MIPCACGLARDHVLAWRRTADGRAVLLHSTGAVTGVDCLPLDGVPAARPRTAEARRRDLAAGWLVVGEAGLYDADELPALYATARRLAARDLGATPGELRAAFAEAEDNARLDRVARQIRWLHVCEGLYEGRLPRLRWPDLVVSREGGRYDVCVVVGRLGAGGRIAEVAEPTGRVFASLRDLARWLLNN